MLAGCHASLQQPEGTVKAVHEDETTIKSKNNKDIKKKGTEDNPACAWLALLSLVVVDDSLTLCSRLMCSVEIEQDNGVSWTCV